MQYNHPGFYSSSRSERLCSIIVWPSSRLVLLGPSKIQIPAENANYSQPISLPCLGIYVTSMCLPFLSVVSSPSSHVHAYVCVVSFRPFPPIPSRPISPLPNKPKKCPPLPYPIVDPKENYLFLPTTPSNALAALTSPLLNPPLNTSGSTLVLFACPAANPTSAPPPHLSLVNLTASLNNLPPNPCPRYPLRTVHARITPFPPRMLAVRWCFFPRPGEVTVGSRCRISAPTRTDPRRAPMRMSPGAGRKAAAARR